MPRKISQKQFESVLALPGPQRFDHFVKVVADWQEAWGLFQDGWALAGSADGTSVFPLWPAQEYAAACAQAEWAGFEPRAIPLGDLLEMVLPKLKADGVLPGVFYTPASRGVTPSVDDLVAALEHELGNY